MSAQMPDGFQEIPDAPNPQENVVEDDYLEWLRPDKYGEEWIYQPNGSKNKLIQEGSLGSGSFAVVGKGKVIRYDQDDEVIENAVCKYFYSSEDLHKKYNGRDAKNCWRIHEAVFIKQIKPSNDNLAKFIGFLRMGKTNEIGGIIFEFYGKTLFDTLKNCEKNILEQRTDEIILKQIKELAGAIEYLHREFNLAHCNITPSNILMPEGPTGKIVLTDLGSARVLADSNTLNPHEVIRDVGDRKARYKKSSDYYSFGLTVYYLTSRRVPYDKFEEKSDMITATNTMLLMFLKNTDWTTLPQDPRRMWLIVKGCERESTFGDLVVDGKHPRPDFNHDTIPFCFPFVRKHIIEPCWEHDPDSRLDMLTCFARLNKTAPVLPTKVKENGNLAHLILNTANGRKHIILLFVPFPINGTCEKEEEICQVFDDVSRYEIVCCIPDEFEYSNAKKFPFKILEDPSKQLYEKFNMDSTSTGGGVAWIDSDDILRFHKTDLSRNSLERLKETILQQPV